MGSSARLERGEKDCETKNRAVTAQRLQNDIRAILLNITIAEEIPIWKQAREVRFRGRPPPLPFLSQAVDLVDGADFVDEVKVTTAPVFPGVHRVHKVHTVH
jgi:hypothetical protein